MWKLTLTKSILRLSTTSRTFATEAPKSAKLILNLTTPHETFYEMQEVERVDIPATSGDMGVLSNHVPTIQQLRPGVIDVSMDGGKNKKFFVSGGFAVMNPDNTLNVNVLEAVTFDQIDKSQVKHFLATAQQKLEKVSVEAERALLTAEIDVYQAMEKL